MMIIHAAIGMLHELRRDVWVRAVPHTFRIAKRGLEIADHLSARRIPRLYSQILLLGIDYFLGLANVT